MTVTFDTSLLVSYYQARQGQAAAAAGASQKPATKIPTAPWNTGAKAPTLNQAAAAVLAGGRFVDPSSAKLDVPGAPADYKDLFALNQGLSALEGLANQAQDVSLTPDRRAELNTRFAAGLKEVKAFLAGQPFDKLSIAAGAISPSVTAGASVKRETPSYVTGALVTGSPDQEIPGLTGDLSFDIAFSNASADTRSLSVDLSQVSGPRTLANVVSYLNARLKAAGVSSRFSVQRTPATPDTVQAGGKTITLSPGQDSYALKLTGAVGETPTFLPSDASRAVYLSHAVGSGDDASSSLAKLNTSGSAAGAADVRFDRPLPAGVTDVRATATAPDGSVYVLAQGSGDAAGQAVKGAQDVVLLKYDSAGGLSYARTLGAAASATGFALTVSPDGRQVAIAGSVTGALGDDGGADASVADSFVSVYGADGVEGWTHRFGAAAEDQANAVAFGADGQVYVAGSTRSALPGAQAQGGRDGYLASFSKTGAALGSAQFGTGGSDQATGLSVTSDGRVVTTSVENGRGVLRLFDPPRGPGAQASYVRDLGDLGGGSLLAVASAPDGSLRLAGSASGGLTLGTETASYAGGRSVFAATLSADLRPSADDHVAWWSAGADARATAATISDGEVFVAGTTGAPGAATKGFGVGLDPSTGATVWSRAFTAGGGDAPTALSVDAHGSSVLDALGLPQGALDYSDAADLVSATALRPGDGFKIAVGSAPARNVVVEAGDTLADLAARINRATGFASAAKVTSVGGYDRLVIAPSASGAALTLSSGAPGADALKALGLSEGVVATPAKALGKTPAAKSYGLNLVGDAGLTSVAAAKAATAKVSAAATIVRQAYAELADGSKAVKPGKTGGTVPAYLTQQIANYQAALARLTG